MKPEKLRRFISRSVSLASFLALPTLAFLSLVLSNTAAARSLEEDVQAYIRVFSGDKQLHSELADTLSYMGLSDMRLFDIVEKHLLDDHQMAKDDRPERNRVARYIRALRFSGQEKYLPTIHRFLEYPSYGRFARAATDDLPLYQKWNPIISNRTGFDPKYSDDANRVINMLRANDLQLNGLGAKRVYFAVRDEAVVELLAQKLQANYMRNARASEDRDALAWMVKALGSTKNTRYQPLIEEVAAKAPDGRVREHAEKWLAKKRPALDPDRRRSR